ncbi:MAG: ABC transporter [Alphaproteobacteria bacterium GWF2_58_20]|nr:MAG: ABC transporter [Alphaproteobacteria bacterium GWF2_58_20]
MKHKPIIELRDVHLTLGSQAGPVHILRGIDLTVNRGETVSVVGPSGSGKSSMMMIMGGLERATSGSVHVSGHNLSTMSEDALAIFRRDHVGIIFQDFHLIPAMSALENVAIPLEFSGHPNPFEAAAQGLERVGLGHRLCHQPGQLSGGEQQRVAIARALACAPDILLADEPTGNLDGQTGALVMDLLLELTSHHNTALVLITHAQELAARCNRRIHLVDGQVTDA